MLLFNLSQNSKKISQYFLLPVGGNSLLNCLKITSAEMASQLAVHLPTLLIRANSTFDESRNLYSSSFSVFYLIAKAPSL